MAGTPDIAATTKQLERIGADIDAHLDEIALIPGAPFPEAFGAKIVKAEQIIETLTPLAAKIVKAEQIIETLTALAAQDGIHKVRIPGTTTDAWLEHDKAIEIAMEHLGGTDVFDPATQSEEVEKQI